MSRDLRRPVQPEQVARTDGRKASLTGGLRPDLLRAMNTPSGSRSVRLIGLVLLAFVALCWSGCASKLAPVARGESSDSNDPKSTMEPVGAYSPSPIKIR